MITKLFTVAGKQIWQLLIYRKLALFDYTTSKKHYGTVYLLHGWGDNQTAWVKGGGVNTIINDLETKGTIDSYIYVMPYALKSYYVNYYTDKYNYMDMFASELVPYIDSLYRTKAEANYRAVVGYSMGGYGVINAAGAGYMAPLFYLINILKSLISLYH